MSEIKGQACINKPFRAQGMVGCSGYLSVDFLKSETFVKEVFDTDENNAGPVGKPVIDLQIEDPESIAGRSGLGGAFTQAGTTEIFS